MSAIATNTRSTSGIPAGTAPACVAHASFLKPDQMKPVQASVEVVIRLKSPEVVWLNKNIGLVWILTLN